MVGFGSNDALEEIDLEKLESLENLLIVLQRVEKNSRVYEDPVFAKAEARLKIQSPQELILQLEKIWRTKPEYDHRAKVRAVLVSYQEKRPLAAASRSEDAVNDACNEELGELGDLAEEMLEKLPQIWQE